MHDTVHIENRPPNRLFIRKIVPVISLTFICVPLIISPFFPLTALMFYLIYVSLWLIRSCYYSIYLCYSFYIVRKMQRVDWHKALSHPDLKGVPSRLKKDLKEPWINPKEVHHIVVIANSKEPYAIIEDTLRSIERTTYAKDKVHIVMAFEDRFRSVCKTNEALIKEHFSSIFPHMHFFYHPDKVAGEVRGKGPNISYAMEEYVRSQHLIRHDSDKYVVTSLDADNKLPAYYFDCLSLTYAFQPYATQKSYQPLPFFFNNIWDVPFTNRLMSMTHTICQMTDSVRPGRVRNFSAHSQPLTALIHTKFWARDTIVEDGHQYWRTYFYYQGNYDVISLLIPIYQDAVEGNGIKATLQAQYKQLRRWAWGATDVEFVWHHMIKQWRHLPKFHTICLFTELVWSHIVWATAAIVMFQVSFVPFLATLIDTRPIGFHFHVMVGQFFIYSILIIFLSLSWSWAALPPPPNKWPFVRKLGLMLEWILYPIVSIIFGSLPALESQFRMLRGEEMGFDITEKKR